MFEGRRKKARKAELDALRTRARAAMVAGQGYYNVNPWTFVLGLLGAVFATLLIIDWLTRDGSKPSAPIPEETTAPNGSREIWIELE